MNEKRSMRFGVKIIFQEFSNFSESFSLILLAPYALWKLLIWTSCSSYQEMIPKGPLNAKKNIFNFESITYSVKQRENEFAGP